ncbi:MAG: 4Fe-4S ferredoxin [Ignavibacteriae bacterium HGW-Ignavibacteriae-2]|jgi:formate dehydrogenase iron-sulfur subunit|nr:MAG: 4Fe-4S ferredoxin [Ignavibacteriae bacterium HGW-Ignavibacteriae-2]
MFKEKGILFDVTLCIGCGSCYEACKEVNKLPQTNNDFLKDHLSDNTFTVVEQYGELYARKLCMHCNDPACASVCLVGAITKSPTGAVVYDAEKCIGCRYCMQACPHKIPRYEWGTTHPRVRKCNLCDERVKTGKLPGCVDACPTEAALFGDMDQIIEIAKQRLKENPDKYYQHIYGLEEAGGSHVLVISPVPFEQLGFGSNLPLEPMPEFTMRAMEKIPSVVVGGGAFLSAMYWLTKRKNQIAKEEKKQTNGN